MLHTEREPAHLLVANRGESHEPEHLLAAGRAVHDAPGKRLRHEVPVGRQVHKQPRLFDQHADAPHAAVFELPVPRRGSIAFEQYDLASRRKGVAADHLHDRRFARAVFSDEAVDVPRSHGHGEIAHHSPAVVDLGQPARFNDIHGRLPSRMYPIASVLSRLYRISSDFQCGRGN